MDSEITQKINTLTNGIYAKEYFTQNGLTYSDAERIRNNLLNKAKDNKLKLIDVEKEILKNIRKDYDKSYTPQEKKFIFNLNNNIHEFSCPHCKNIILIDFKFCPYCGEEVKHKELMLITTGDVDLEKGYVTTEELGKLRLITPEEEKLLSENKVKTDEIGVPLTPENCPFEIRDEVIPDTDNTDDKQRRKELYEKNVVLYKKGIDEVKLLSFNEQIEGINKRFPVDTSKIPQETIKDNTKIKTSPAKDKSRTRKTTKKHSDVKRINTKKEEVKINLEYAAVLYLLDIIKHPTKPKLSDNILYHLDVSSNRKITNYLRKNNFMADAEDYDLIRAKLQQLKVADLKKILSKNDLKVSGRKDELIDRICDEVPKDNLKRYSKGKALKVTNQGQEYIDSHPHVETYARYLKNFEISLYEDVYQENKDLDNNELALKYLDILRDYYAGKLEWYNFSATYTAQTRICNDMKDFEGKLRSVVNEFICSLNPWIDYAINLNYSYPITISMQSDIFKLLDDVDEENIPRVFDEESDNIKLPGLFLEADDMYNYFMRTADEENLDELNEELSNRFDRSHLKNKDVQFVNKKEQKEKYELVKKYFN